jgi:hypothetical protein
MEHEMFDEFDPSSDDMAQDMREWMMELRSQNVRRPALRGEVLA